MNWKYDKLRGKIKQVCGTQEAFAEKLGIGRVSLSQRLNNQLEFSQDEIFKSCEILKIDFSELPCQHIFLLQMFSKLNKNLFKREKEEQPSGVAGGGEIDGIYDCRNGRKETL